MRGSRGEMGVCIPSSKIENGKVVCDARALSSSTISFVDFVCGIADSRGDLNLLQADDCIIFSTKNIILYPDGVISAT